MQYLETVLTGPCLVSSWKRKLNGTHEIHASLPMGSGVYKSISLYVTDTDFSNIDARLPKILKKIADKRTLFVQPYKVQLTYASHWQRDNHRLKYLPTDDYAKPTNDHNEWYIHEFTGIDLNNIESPIVSARLYGIELTGDGVEFVNSMLVCNLYELPVWLHECIPGGLSIFNALKALDVDANAWVSHLRATYEKRVFRRARDEVSSVALPHDLC